MLLLVLLSVTSGHAFALITTTTAVSGPASLPVTGQSVTYMATVTGSGGPPTGTVTFTIKDKNNTTVATGSSPLDSTGKATSSPSPLIGSGSLYAVTATYVPTGYFDASTGTLAQAVSPAATTTSLTSSSPTSVFGQTVTFTATVAAVAPGTGTPHGAVQFAVDGTAVGSAQNLASGVATYSTSTLSATSHTVTAAYSDGTGDFGSSSANLIQTVNKADTTTTLSVSPPSPSDFGTSVTFTVTVAAVAPGSGTPTGTVQFAVDGTPVTQPLVSGVATLSSTTLSLGPHTVSAIYQGDSNYNSSLPSNTINYAINSPTNVTLTLTAPAATPVTGEPVTFSAQVTASAPGAGPPTGTVTFTIKDKNNTIVATGSSPLDSTGKATSSPSPLIGSGSLYAVTATYVPTGYFDASTGTLAQAVSPAATTTSLTSSSPTSVFGQTVTFTATVAAVAPGTGTPHGAVQFAVDGTAVGSAQNLASGVATYSTSTLSATSHTVTAAYSDGTGDFGSSSVNLPQTVNKADTTTTATVTGDFNGSDTVTVQINVTANAPGTGTPTGTVQVQVDGNNVATAPSLNNTGTQTVTLKSSDLALGPVPNTSPHAVIVVYSGSASFKPSASSASLVNGLPVIYSLSPGSATAGTTVPVVITGDNFSVNLDGTISSTVNFNGQTNLPATPVPGHNNEITVSLNLTGITLGTYILSVTNLTPGGGTSNSIPFVVNPTTPVLTSINPASGNANAVTTLTLTGANFTSPTTDTTEQVTFTLGSSSKTYKATDTINGQPIMSVSNNGTTLTLTGITLPKLPGNYGVTVSNSNGGPSSPPVTFVITNSVPTLTSISPATGIGGAFQDTATPPKAYIFTLVGTSFTATGNIVTFTPAFQTSNQLNDTKNFTGLPSADGKTLTLTLDATHPLPPDAGQYNVTVTNGNSLTTNPQTFTVSGVPTLTSVSPTGGTTGKSIDLTLTGTNFDPTPNSNKILFNHTALATQVITSVIKGSSDTLTATVILPAAGSYTVDIQNSNGQSANTTQPTFSVSLDTPTISTITPTSSAPMKGVNVSIAGTNFDTVKANTVRITVGPISLNFPATAINTTSLTVTMDLSTFNIVAGQTGTLKVNNGIGDSNTVPFTITGNPVLTTVNPTSGAAGSKVVITLSGANFSTTSPNKVILTLDTTPVLGIADLNDTTQSLTSPDGKTLRVTLDLSADQVPKLTGTGSIIVDNGTVHSNLVSFAVVGPAVSSLSRSSVIVDDPTVVTNNVTVKDVDVTLPLTINGSNFSPNAQVVYSDSAGHKFTFSRAENPAHFTWIDPNTITIELPANPHNPSLGLLSNPPPSLQSQLTSGTPQVLPDLIGQADRYSITVNDAVSTDAVNTVASATPLSFTVQPLHSFTPGLQMISAPYDYSNNSANTVPSFDLNSMVDPVDYVWGYINSVGQLNPDLQNQKQTYDPNLATYVDSLYTYTKPLAGSSSSFPNPATRLLLGRGYWVRIPDAGVSVSPGYGDSIIRRGTAAAAVTAINPFTGATDNSTDPRTGQVADGKSVLQEGNLFPILLQPGWNMIGDPATSEIPLANLRLRVDTHDPKTSGEDTFAAAAQAGLVLPYVLTYDGSKYITTGKLSPYVGYWIYAYQPLKLQWKVQLLVPVQ